MDSVKVLERSQVSPPAGSVPTTSLPLTFLDIPWLLCHQTQRLHFYEFPHSTHHFLQTVLPTLKHSLSLTLRHFFPFAANLVLPSSLPAKPYILFADGGSVQFTVAESAGDFNSLSANRPLAVEELKPFVPDLPPPAHVEGGARVVPILALQVTLFPNLGMCIGVRCNHVAADGRAFQHFMNSWASVCKTGEELTCLGETSLPSHDRAAILDSDGLETIFLKEWWNSASRWDAAESPADETLADEVRVTIVMGQAQIEKLKRWVTNQLHNDDDSLTFHISSFVVTCALIWVCLTKAEDSNDNDNEPYYFKFVADCRNRLEFPVPKTYFGNCLSICFVPLKRKELLGENGILEAVKAIGKRVGELESGALKGAEEWMLKWKELAELRKYVWVAGSPKLGFYDSDFGWGRPKRTEPVGVSGAISLAENVNDKSGGIEVGLVLSKDNMDHFKAIFDQSLKLISDSN